MRFTICEKCKYNFEGECEFYSMGSGNDIDKPCRGEEEDAFSDSVMDNLRVEEENVDEIKLKPCPFCGCEEINSHTGSFGYVFFHCQRCLASVTFDKDVYSYKPQEAEKAWNRRMNDG